jgi:hypothetical protein
MDKVNVELHGLPAPFSEVLEFLRSEKPDPIMATHSLRVPADSVRSNFRTLRDVAGVSAPPREGLSGADLDHGIQ